MSEDTASWIGAFVIVLAVIAAIAFHDDVLTWYTTTTVECTDEHNKDYTKSKTTCKVR